MPNYIELIMDFVGELPSKRGSWETGPGRETVLYSYDTVVLLYHEPS